MIQKDKKKESNIRKRVTIIYKTFGLVVLGVIIGIAISSEKNSMKDKVVSSESEAVLLQKYDENENETKKVDTQNTVKEEKISKEQVKKDVKNNEKIINKNILDKKASNKKSSNKKVSNQKLSEKKISENTYIGKEKAKQIAFNDAKVASNKISKVEVELDYDNGKYIYEIGFNYSNIEYDYEINANNGKILKKEKEVENRVHKKNQTGEKINKENYVDDRYDDDYDDRDDGDRYDD